MPFVFGIIGIVLIISGVRGTVTDTNPNLVSLLKDDFTGSPNFVEWSAAILVVGAIGYIKALEPLSRAFLVLIVIGLIWSNKGFFSKVNQELQAKTTTPTATTNTSQASTQSTPTGLDNLLNNSYNESTMTGDFMTNLFSNLTSTFSPM
jgi:hypothetical protein